MSAIKKTWVWIFVFTVIAVLCVIHTEHRELPYELLAFYRTPSGWRVIKDVEPSKTLDVSKLRPLAILRDGESWINNDTVSQRAIDVQANWGLVDGMRILESWKPHLSKQLVSISIPLPGTQLRDSEGVVYVPEIYCCSDYGRYSDSGCTLIFSRIANGWYGNDRFLANE